MFLASFVLLWPQISAAESTDSNADYTDHAALTSEVVFGGMAVYGDLKARTVELKWTTMAEVNNEEFRIESSEDQENWTQIGTVPGAGQSSTAVVYNFRDEHVPVDGIYYRIAWVGESGEETSPVAYVQLGEPVVYKGNGSIGSTRSITGSHVEFAGMAAYGDLKARTVELKWTTMAEVNNEEFRIESSEDQESWTQIGSVPGAGNSSTAVVYNFRDEHVPVDGIYYRIAWVGESGDETSAVAYVQLGEPVIYKGNGSIGSTRSIIGSHVEFAGMAAYGDLKARTVELKWTTMAEVNNEEFRIESSEDQESWTQIGSVPGAGNSSTAVVYNFRDEHVPVDGIYYRIAWVGESGDETSPVAYVQLGEPVVYKGNGSNSTRSLNDSQVEFGGLAAYGDLKARTVELKWTTLSELNNEMFRIESSEDQHVWNEIGSVPGAAQSDAMLVYTFRDEQVPVDGIYYRIAWVGESGEETSAVAYVQLGEPVVYKGTFGDANTRSTTGPQVEFGGLAAYGDLKARTVELKWTTLSELNNEMFRIESSEDQHVWNEIGSVPGAAQSDAMLVYTFRDEQVPVDGIYYRIVWVGESGDETSAVAYVQLGEPVFYRGTNMVTNTRSITGSHVEFAGMAAYGDLKARTVELKWTTMAEVNNEEFRIESSEDQENWTQIGTVPGAGQSSTAVVYNFRDEHVPVDGIYYRIAWVGESGEETSPVAYVQLGEPVVYKGNGSIGSTRSITGSHVEFAGMAAYGDLKARTVELKWTTMAEVNNEEFRIESSEDQESWTQIGSVPGAGNSSTAVVYNFRDEHVPVDGIYYRIAWVGESGDETSAVAYVQLGEPVIYKGNGSIGSTRSIIGSHVEFAGMAAYGDLKARTVELKWTTMAEVNNEEFRIENSEDQESWTQIGSVPGAGNSSTAVVYNFRDEHVPVDGIYYRIAWVGESGDETSPVAYVQLGEPVVYGKEAMNTRSVSSQPAKVYSTYPNPATTETRISTNGEIEVTGKVRLTSTDGQRYRVKVKEFGNEIELDLTGIPAGIYIVHLGDGFARIQKR